MILLLSFLGAYALFGLLTAGAAGSKYLRNHPKVYTHDYPGWCATWFGVWAAVTWPAYWLVRLGMSL